MSLKNKSACLVLGGKCPIFVSLANKMCSLIQVAFDKARQLNPLCSDTVMAQVGSHGTYSLFMQSFFYSFTCMHACIHIHLHLVMSFHIPILLLILLLLTESFALPSAQIFVYCGHVPLTNTACKIIGICQQSPTISQSQIGIKISWNPWGLSQLICKLQLLGRQNLHCLIFLTMCFLTTFLMPYI